MASTYLLNIFLPKPRVIRIGKLGSFHFPGGYYVYVGSAKKNFHQRIDRHLRKKKRAYWHIDHLLRFGRVTTVWSCPLSEEQTAAILTKKMDSPVPRFGASDKRSKSHLFNGKVGVSTLGLGLSRVR
ncbi:MAG: GIY-YIG nuclease family protein [candidate division WOR-3 bacterium]|jgi:Uri superfamily endonuclease